MPFINHRHKEFLTKLQNLNKVNDLKIISTTAWSFPVKHNGTLAIQNNIQITS